MTMRICPTLLPQTLLLFCLALGAIATAEGKDRIALVIGNGAYTELGALANTVNDAHAIGESLSALGYKTKLITDLDGRAFRRELSQFARLSERADAAVLFYAGHGVQVGGENFLLPTDMEAPQNETDIKLSGLKVDDLIAALKSDVRIVILDACRENPIISRSLSRGRGANVSSGLAAVRAPPAETFTGGGVFIAYATEAGNVALDGDSQHSPFTEALLRHIGKPISIDDMFSLVTRDVRIATKNAQRPYKYASLESIICLNTSCGLQAGGTPQGQAEIDAVGRATAPASNLILGNPRSLSPSILSYLNSNLRQESESAQEGFRQRAITANLRSIPGWIKIGSLDEGATELFYHPASVIFYSDRVYVRLKGIYSEKTMPAVDNDKVAYEIEDRVFDCLSMRTTIVERAGFNATGKRLRGNVYGDARTIRIDQAVASGSVAESLSILMCNPAHAGRLVEPDGLSSDDWIVVGAIVEGTEKVSVLPSAATYSGDIATLLVKNTPFSQKKDAATGAIYSSSLNLVSVNCRDETFTVTHVEFVDDRGLPIAKAPTLRPRFDKPTPGSVAHNLLQLGCQSKATRADIEK